MAEITAEAAALAVRAAEAQVGMAAALTELMDLAAVAAVRTLVLRVLAAQA